MNHSPSIRLIDLSTGYTTPKRQIVIANRINATINQGELTCLLGANGAGKSTLLRTLSGFQPPLAGEIQLMGKSLKAYSDKQLARVIGVVLTDKCEIRNMSVMELVGLGRSPYTGFWGTLGETDREIVHQALARVKIERFARRMIQTLSDGERQKVMIAKALAQETPIIFLDEPTAFLDFPSKVEIMQLLHELSRGMGKTVFMSTHDLELALQIADKIWLMDREKGLRVGTPEDLALDGALDHLTISSSAKAWLSMRRQAFSASTTRFNASCGSKAKARATPWPARLWPETGFKPNVDSTPRSPSAAARRPALLSPSSRPMAKRKFAPSRNCSDSSIEIFLSPKRDLSHRGLVL